jgi:transposase
VVTPILPPSKGILVLRHAHPINQTGGSGLRSRGITAVIPERSDQIRNRQRRGSRGGRPVSYDQEAYKSRNVVERSFNVFKEWRGLATRYDKLALTYRGGAVLRTIVVWLRRLGDTP